MSILLYINEQINHQTKKGNPKWKNKIYEIFAKCFYY